MDQSEQPKLVDASDASAEPDTSDGFSESDDDRRSILEARIELWKNQLQRELLTPLLQIEMEDAIAVMTQRIQHWKPRCSTDVDLMDSMQSLHHNITKHWCKVFKNPIDRTVLLININHYEAFFIGMLYEDYITKPTKPVETWTVLPSDDWFSDLSSEVQHNGQRKHGSHSIKDGNYRENILLPLEEMNLGYLIPHAENRICAAAAARQAGAKGTGAYVSRLIQACEWKGLAGSLIHDRQLFDELCNHRTYLNKTALATLRPTILQRMDVLQRTYFTNLSSPTNYIISEHAASLLARHSSSGPDHVALLRLPEAQIHASPISKIKNRLRLLADGLNLKFRKDGDPSSPSSANPEEKSHLLFQSQKSTATSSIRSDEKGSPVGLMEKTVEQ